LFFSFDNFISSSARDKLESCLLLLLIVVVADGSTLLLKFFIACFAYSTIFSALSFGIASISPTYPEALFFISFYHINLLLLELYFSFGYYFSH
jgi:hypothetical protein